MGEKKKERRGRGRKKTSVWDDVCVNACVLSVSVIAQSPEAFGGHAQFQLASLSRAPLENAEVKGSNKPLNLRRLFPREIVKICPQLGMW